MMGSLTGILPLLIGALVIGLVAGGISAAKGKSALQVFVWVYGVGLLVAGVGFSLYGKAILVLLGVAAVGVFTLVPFSIGFTLGRLLDTKPLQSPLIEQLPHSPNSPFDTGANSAGQLNR